MTGSRRRLLLSGAALLSAAVAGCGGNPATPASRNAPGIAAAPLTAPAADSPSRSYMLTGAGATFPAPLYSRWFDDYHKVHPEVAVNYQAIGSGGGIQQLKARTVDFAASDVPLTAEEAGSMPSTVLHLPMAAGAVAIVYHLPPGLEQLQLTGEAIAGIFRGTIKEWNDPAILASNAGVKLPGTRIAVVHRSDGSGTTSLLTNYLSAVSAEWKAQIGSGKSVNWPVGVGGKGNEGVTALVRQTPSAIGYVELEYALRNHVTVAAVGNQGGAFLEPSLKTIQAAIDSAGSQLENDVRTPLINPPSPSAYPIAGLTYIIIYKDQPAEPKGKGIADLLAWCMRDGRQTATRLQYAPLPDALVKVNQAALASMTFQGKPLLRSPAPAQP